MDAVSKLTMRQVSLIYYRPRNKKTGVPNKIDPEFGVVSDMGKNQFFSMGLALGRSYKELSESWERENGDSS